MLQIPCLHCGPRNAQEFEHAGEIVEQPQAERATPLLWREFLYLRDNPAGWVWERWYHLGCTRFIEVERHTVTNAVRAVREPAAQRRQREAGGETTS